MSEKQPRLTHWQERDRYNTAYSLCKNALVVLAKSESWSRHDRKAYMEKVLRSADNALKGEPLLDVELPESATN